MTNTHWLRRLAAAAAIGLVVVTGACGDDDDDGASDDDTTATTAAPSGTTAAAANTVTIKDFKFSALSAKGGAPITVKNEDQATHTYTAVDGTFDAGTVPAGSTASFTAPSKAGDYKVKCNIHATMSGTLTVT